MAHEVRTPPLQPAAVAASQASKKGLVDYVDVVLEGLWHLLTSMRVAMVMMIVLAVLCVIGSLVIQIPSGMADGGQLEAQWLQGVRPRFGGWTDIMDTLGLFNIFNSVVFRVLVAGLTISLIACTVHRLPGVWRTATKPRVDVGPGFFEHAPQHESIVVHAASADTLATVQSVLRKRRYRILSQDDGVVHLYADRFRFMAFSSLIGHVSLVLILLGAIVGTSFGYRNPEFVIAEGTTLPTGTEPGLSMKLIDFTDTWYTSTANLPQDYASKVELYKDGTLVAAQTIRVNEPLSYDGATYYQKAYGQAAVMTVKDASGNVVYSEGLPLDATAADGSDRAAGILDLPGSSDEIYVFGTTGTSDTTVQPGQVRAVLFSTANGSTVDDKVLDQGKAQSLGGYTVTFNRESKYTLLSINRDPGQLLIWLGALLLFAGFTLVFLLPQRRVWARISTRGAMSVLSVASLGRRDAALGTDFDDLVTDIRAALQAPAQG
jgi:cytochrome c biogenesis protein